MMGARGAKIKWDQYFPVCKITCNVIYLDCCPCITFYFICCWGPKLVNKHQNY